MATIKILMFDEMEIYSVIARSHIAISLDDIARALDLCTADQLLPLVNKLGLECAVYEVPLVDRGKMQMMTVDELQRMLNAYGSDTAQRLAGWLGQTFGGDCHEGRFNGLSDEEIQRIRIRDSVARIMHLRPDVTSAEVAQQLDIEPSEAENHLRYLRIIESVGQFLI